MADELPKRWPLVTNPQNRRDDPRFDSRLVNCYAELDPQKQEYNVVVRPGIANVGFPAVAYGVGLGIYLWPKSPLDADLCMIVSNAGVHTFYADNVAIDTVGANTSARRRFVFQPILSSPTTLFFHQGLPSTSYTYDGTNVTAITDPVYTGFEAKLVQGIAYLNGRVYVLTYDNELYGAANLEDATAWSALNMIKANDTTGYSVGISRHLQYILAFKRASVEAFYDAGNATGSPLSRVEGVRIPYGLYQFETLVSINDESFWVSNQSLEYIEDIDLRVVRMHGLESRVISNSYIERLLPNILSATVVRFAGQRFYVLWGNTSSNFSLWYNIDTEVWQEFTSDAYNDIGVDSTPYQSHQVQMTDTGRVIYFEPTQGYDINAALQIKPLTTDIYTPNMDFDADRIKYLPTIYINADRVKGAVVKVRYTDDDYVSWSNFQDVDLSLEKPMLTDQGSFYRRAYHLNYTSVVPQRFRSCGLDLDVGVM